MSAVYKFPYDTPLRYLPLVYMLPHDLLIRCPTLRRVPRSMGTLNASPEWGKVIQSDAFLNEVMDAVASLAFPQFGFGGWKEHYTGWCPVWRLSYSLPLWAKGVEQVRGWGLQSLFRLPPDFEKTTPTYPSTRLKRLPDAFCRTYSLSTRARRASGSLQNGRSNGRRRSRRQKQNRTKRAGAL